MVGRGFLGGRCACRVDHRGTHGIFRSAGTGPSRGTNRSLFRACLPAGTPPASRALTVCRSEARSALVGPMRRLVRAPNYVIVVVSVLRIERGGRARRVGGRTVQAWSGASNRGGGRSRSASTLPSPAATRDGQLLSGPTGSASLRCGGDPTQRLSRLLGDADPANCLTPSAVAVAVGCSAISDLQRHVGGADDQAAAGAAGRS